MSERLKAFFENQSPDTKLAAVLLWECISQGGQLHEIASDACNAYRSEVLGELEALANDANDTQSFAAGLLLAKIA